MRQAGAIARLGTILVILLLSLLCPRQLTAQPVNADQVKAAYIYAFAKFVTWPDDAFYSPASPLRLCVWKSAPLQPHLAEIVKGKSIANRALEVAAVDSSDQAVHCHMLFVGGENTVISHPVAAALKGSRVVTIGEADNFLEQGGIIHFLIRDNRVLFEVNYRAATAARLYISSKMLSVAHRVIQ